MELKCGVSKNLETRDTAENFTALRVTQTEKRNNGNPKGEMTIIQMRFVWDVMQSKVAPVFN
jgi:hypothetical protein